MVINAINSILAFVGVLFLGVNSTTPVSSDDFNANNTSDTPVVAANLNEFALCLKEKEVKFYGAFWCPHCQNQKALFGKSSELLPYVECSTADGQNQLAVCEEAGITGYPTWSFADGSKIDGEMSLEALAEKAKCALPKV